MNLLNIAKTIGSVAINVAAPGLLTAINAALPTGVNLPEAATGADLQQAVDQLPPDQRAEVLTRQLDVRLAAIDQAGQSNRTMLATEQASQHTTRPYIAKGAFHVVAFCSLAVISVWCVGVLRGDVAVITAANSGADLVIYLLGPLVALLWAYFGILKTEQRQRLDAANSHPSGGLGALVGAVAAMVKR